MAKFIVYREQVDIQAVIVEADSDIQAKDRVANKAAGTTVGNPYFEQILLNHWAGWKTEQVKSVKYVYNAGQTFPRTDNPHDYLTDGPVYDVLKFNGAGQYSTYVLVAFPSKVFPTYAFEDAQ